MGFQIQTNAPQCVINGRTIAIGAFDWGSVIGNFYRIAVFELKNNEWVQISRALDYASHDALLADIQGKGGMAKFIEWLKALLNSWLAELFGTPVVVGEPTTGTDAANAVTAVVNGFAIEVVNGVPVVK